MTIEIYIDKGVCVRRESNFKTAFSLIIAGSDIFIFDAYILSAKRPAVDFTCSDGTRSGVGGAKTGGYSKCCGGS